VLLGLCAGESGAAAEEAVYLAVVTTSKAEKQGQADGWQLSEESRGLLKAATVAGR
jgi:hypothetical protein